MVTALLSSVEEDGAVRASAHVGIMLQARAFETSRRRDVLSFSHHREVALLSPADADRWLDWAEEPLRDRGKPTSSMGRLTLTVLLSFAQFEREVMDERHPRQDRRLEEERDVDERRAAVSGAGPQARHHRQRGGNCSLDLSPLCGTRLGPAFEGRARSLKDRQRIVDERFGSPRRGQAVLTRRALPDFAEPYLSRIRIAGNKAASSRSLTSAAG